MVSAQIGHADKQEFRLVNILRRPNGIAEGGTEGSKNGVLPSHPSRVEHANC
jgi:hypothetical protein